MSKNQNKRKQTRSENKKAPLDPYTGEVEVPAEDAYKVDELIPVDSGDREGEDFLLEEETPLDKIAGDAEADAINERTNRYTDDENIEEVFTERQKLGSGGRQKLEEKLDEHTAQNPKLTADDLDAAWEGSIVSGDESVGEMAPTPGQDVVDNIGDALGITYDDDEPLSGEEKLRERDRNRLEPNEIE